MKTFIQYLIGIVVLVGLFYGIWQLQRTINFNLSYEDQVKEVIHEETDPELKKLRVKINELEDEIKDLKNGKYNDNGFYYRF